MTDDFLRKLHSVAFRVTKAECLDLPAITEEVRTMDLEKDAIKLYDSIEDESYAELDESEVTTANILTRLLRLSQITGGHLTDVKGFCAVATTKEIAKQDYILTPGRYVGIEEQEDDGEPFEEKMKRLTSELSDMFAKSHELEEEIRRKLGAIGYELK